MKKQLYDFGVLGGDARQISAAHHLTEAGYRVICYMPGEDFPIQAASMEECIACSNMLVAPLPFRALSDTDNGENFYQLLAREGKEGQILFSGPLPSSVEAKLRNAKIRLHNVSANPVFSEENAQLTAEGVITELLSHCRHSLYKSRILLTGYGTCGRAIAKVLSGFQAQLTICDCDEAILRNLCSDTGVSTHFSTLRPEELSTALSQFDFVINTAPCLIFDQTLLQNASESTLFLDIASLPGGIDMTAAAALSLIAKQLPGLPAKVSPQAAGQFYAEAILKLLHPVSLIPAASDSAGALHGRAIGIALTGSFCTYSKIWTELEKLKDAGATLLFILSHSAASIACRFGKPEEYLEKIYALTDKPPIFTIEDAEPIGPGSLLDALVIFPCTGNTAAKLSCGITDTAVLMAAKAHLRNEKPLILSLATNDALGMNMKNIGLLLNARHLYFVPFGQDDPVKKPNSMTAHTQLLLPTLEAALSGKQLQPVIPSHETSQSVAATTNTAPPSPLLSAAEQHTHDTLPHTAKGGSTTCAE